MNYNEWKNPLYICKRGFFAVTAMPIDQIWQNTAYFLAGISEGKNIAEAYEYAHTKVDFFYIGVEKEGKDEPDRTPSIYYPGYLVGDTKQYLNWERNLLWKNSLNMVGFIIQMK